MPISREYIEYIKSEMERRKVSWYEHVCNFFGRVPVKISLDKKTGEKISGQLEFCDLKTTPQSVFLTSLAVAGITIILSVILMFFGFATLGILLLVSGAVFAYYIYIYPMNLSKFYRIRSSSDLLLTILYMVVSLRISPNLENALMFAAVNIKGPVGKGLKKTAWDLAVGMHDNADTALGHFTDEWREENEEFSEAVDIIRTSMLKAEDERLKMYEEAINFLMERNTDRMKNYTSQLMTPITIISYMGITLPLLTIIMFPIMTIFLSQAIKPYLLVIVYNIGLPLIVYFLMTEVLKKRPFSFGVIDVSSHPEAHRPGMWKLGSSSIPLLPVCMLIAVSVVLLGAYVIFVTEEDVSLTKIGGGLIVVWGIALALIIYSFLSFYRNIDIKNEIRRSETEFTEALFQFGQILRSGYSVEISIKKLLVKIRNLTVSRLFSMALENINKLGFSLHRALFDKDMGVIKYYPSKLLKNILGIVVESMQKGSLITADAMVSISGYLKSIQRIEQYLREILTEITSEMEFMLSVLAPVSCGVVIGLAALMTSVIVNIAMFLGSVAGISGPFSSPTTLTPLVDPKNIVPIEWFIVIVGGYMIEITVLLSMFISALQYGEDPLETYKLIVNGIGRGMVILTLLSVLIFLILGGLVQFG